MMSIGDILQIQRHIQVESRRMEIYTTQTATVGDFIAILEKENWI